MLWDEGRGARRSQIEDLLDLLASSKVVRTRWRQQRLGGGQAAAVQQVRDRITQAATRVRNAENVIIPGLLQISGYARTGCSASAWAT